MGLTGHCLATSAAVARTIQDGSWEMAGLLTFLDPPRPDTKVWGACQPTLRCDMAVAAD